MNTENQINDGGPAFPSSPTCGPNGELYRPVDIGCEGMSLRDWFAGQALAGLLTQPAEIEFGAGHFAQGAYEMADAMLTARNNTKP